MSVTFVTPSDAENTYILRIEQGLTPASNGETQMTKLFSILAAAALFVPCAMVTVMQAAQMVA